MNVQDKEGNTPLHETYLTAVTEELLKLGANVNARNKSGETPIFTTIDDDAIPLLIRHGANVSIRNKAGQTLLEASKDRIGVDEEVLRKAIDEAKSR